MVGAEDEKHMTATIDPGEDVPVVQSTELVRRSWMSNDQVPRCSRATVGCAENKA